MRPEAAMEFGWTGTITCVLANGKAAWVAFCDPPSDAPPEAVAYQRYVNPRLLEPLKEIKMKAKAAELDARVGEFDVDAVNVHQRGGVSRPRLPASSPEGQVLVAKAKALVDWLDLRNARAVTTPVEDVSGAMGKFGHLTLYLRTPVKLTIEVWEGGTVPGEFGAAPIGTNIRFDTFLCSQIVVFDYGNYIPPLLAFQNMEQPKTYYLCPWLTRRAQEKYGIEKLGFPGHPVSDTAYYTPPEQLYKSLQEYIGKLQ